MIAKPRFNLHFSLRSLIHEIKASAIGYCKKAISIKGLDF